MQLSVIITGERLAEVNAGGRSRLFLGIQKGEEIVDTVGTNAERAIFTASFTVSPLPDGGTNFSGPYAHGPRTARFCYLCWLAENSDSLPVRFARIKIPLSSLPWERAEAAARAGAPLALRFSLVGKGGGPVCASVPLGAIQWDG